ncbi:MAG: dethiobiotin synthase [Acidiferrobacterales bacterium]
MKVSGYFVTGTDTGVGKTVIAAALIRKLAGDGHKVAGMKPVASGCRNTALGLRNEDAEALIAASSIPLEYGIVNPYAFAPAISPHLAANEAGQKIELERILDCFESIAGSCDMVVVEGVGGWRVPLGRVITTEHMAKALDLPVILVVGMRLGCLNHALLTADAIANSGMVLAGWVANRVDPQMERVDENIETLVQRIPAPLLGQVPFLEQTEPATITQHLHLPPI